MKNKTFLVAFLLFSWNATGAHSEEITIGKFTLASGEKRTLSLESKTPFKVGFTNEMPMEQIRRCQNRCIGMNVIGDPYSEVTASVGTAIRVNPKGGKADVVFKNLEAFPITISVQRE